MRYTKKDVEFKYIAIINLLHINEDDCYMRVWAPGDGQTRYEFMFSYSDGTCTTLNACGTRNAWNMLCAFYQGVDLAQHPTL